MAPYMAPWSVRASDRHALLGDPSGHLPDAAQAVEQAELGVDVEVDEVVRGRNLGARRVTHRW